MIFKSGGFRWTCLAVGVFWLSGCGAKTGTGSDAFDRTALLAHLGADIIVPAVEDADDAVRQLQKAVASYCQAVGTADESESRTTAQAAWKRAMVAWQFVEMMKIGPTAENRGALRDQIYSWPATSSCAVDQDVMVLRAQPATFDITTRLTTRRGLAAIEYLLFTTSFEHTCPASSAPEGWATLSNPQRSEARCRFAEVAIDDVALRTNIVRSGWDPGQGNFLGQLTSAGSSGSSFAKAQDGVNAISDALFYLDLMTKGKKLAAPMGISINRCGSEGQVCVSDLESVHARHARENIQANLESFHRMFLGNDKDGHAGIGFDDFLSELGSAELAATMIADLDAARAAINAIETPLDQAIVNSPDQVVVVHDRIKAVCDQLKSQFLTILGLEIPDAAAGDND
jgi:predicted lipoprotein